MSVASIGKDRTRPVTTRAGAAAGAIAMICFAQLGARLFGHASSAWALIAATLGWLTVAVGCYAVGWALGYGNGETTRASTGTAGRP